MKKTLTCLCIVILLSLGFTAYAATPNAKGKIEAFEDLVLVDKNGIKVYLTGEYEDWNADLYLYAVFINKSNKKVHIGYTGTVNGWFLGNVTIPGEAFNLPPNSKAKGKISFKCEEIEADSCTEIEEMNLVISVTDSSANKKWFSVDTGLIKPDSHSVAAEITQPTMLPLGFTAYAATSNVKGKIEAFEDLVLVDKNGIKVYLTGEYEDWNADLYLYAVFINKSNKKVHIGYTGTVNGWFLGNVTIPGEAFNLPPNSKAKGKISFKCEEIEADSCTEIEEMNLVISVTDSSANKKWFSVDTGLIKPDSHSVAAEITQPTKSIVCDTTDYMKVDGLYADKSFVDDKRKNMTMLYMCYTVSTEGKNLKVSSGNSKIIFEGTNDYSSEHYPRACLYMESYYYSAYLTDVYIGDELKVVETFRVPTAELNKGRVIRFENSRIPDSAAISLESDMIVFCDNPEAIAMAADPNGYARMQKKLADADTQTKARVKKAIDGFVWPFYVNNTSYELEFIGNEYELRTMLGATRGTYTIRNGFIVITNSTTQAVNYIPYSFDVTGIDLDVTVAFDVREN